MQLIVDILHSYEFKNLAQTDADKVEKLGYLSVLGMSKKEMMAVGKADPAVILRQK